MGSLCSKSSKYSGGDHVLGPINTNTNRGFQALASPVAPVGTERPDPRTAAAQAAEQRAKAAQTRGTNSSNPNQGRLAAQLQASKAASRAPEPRQQEQLVWD